jgi:hypothetical protein
MKPLPANQTIVFLCLLPLANGFASRGSRRASPATRQYASADGNGTPRVPQWHLSNDFETFLNQRTIQSFLFLVKSLRDPQTVLWVENFTQPALHSGRSSTYTSHLQSGSSNSQLLSYHGLAAMNVTRFPTWDIYFKELLKQPTVIYTVESESKHIPTYDMEINPGRLCARMLAVRQQIAQEFARDLDVVATMGGHTLEAYWESLRASRRTPSAADNDRDIVGNYTSGTNLVFLELHPDPTSDYAPSPLRQGNFDLLVLLATQEAVHRVLNDPARQTGVTKVTNDYLCGFYEQRLDTHFTGGQRYHRAADFLAELLEAPPLLRSVSDGNTALLDPTFMAELLLHQREKVAKEWQLLVQAASEVHMEIQRLQLNRLMSVNTEQSGVHEEQPPLS